MSITGIIEVNDITFASLAMNMDVVNNGHTGYLDIGMDALLDEAEQELLHTIISQYTDEYDRDAVLTIQQKGGAITGVYGGTIWATKDGSPVMTFGKNEIPVTIEDGVVKVGKATIAAGFTKTDIDGKKYFVADWSLEVEDGDDEFTHQINLFIDKEQCGLTKQKKVISDILKDDDIEGLNGILRVKGSGTGYPTALVNVVRALHIAGIKIPQQGIELQVAGFRVQNPPEGEDWKHQLIVDLKGEVPWPALYVDKKDGNQIKPQKSPVRSVLLGAFSPPAKILLDQETGDLKEGFVTRNYLKWIEDDGLFLRITGFNEKKPAQNCPDCVLSKGVANQLPAQKIAEQLKVKSAANNALPMSTSASAGDADVIDAEVTDDRKDELDKVAF